MSTRRPPKKRSSSVFLESDSESSAGGSYKDDIISEDESFQGDESESDGSFLDYGDDDDQDMICTQPVRKSPKKRKRTESSFVQKDDCMDSLASASLPPKDNTSVDPEHTLQTPKNTTISLDLPNVVTDTKKENPQENAVPMIVTQKPSKLRLKLKIKNSSSSTTNKNDDASEKVKDAKESKAKSTEKKQKVEAKGKENKDLEVIDLSEDIPPAASASAKTKAKEVPKTLESNKAPSNADKPKESSPRKTQSTGGVKRKKKKVGKKHSASVAKTESVSKASKPAPAKTSKSSDVKPPEAVKAVPKPKKKKMTFMNQVLLHMMTTMKPYTLKGLAGELQSTDVALSHLMLSLLDKKIVYCKEFGKKVKREMYWVDLEKANKAIYGTDIPSASDMEKAKLELKAALEDEAKHVEVMKQMKSQLTNEELTLRLEEEERNVADLTSKIQEAKDRISGKVKVVEKPKLANRFSRFAPPPQKPKTKKQLNKEINNLRNEWKNRKEKCMDFVYNLSDAMEKKPKDVLKILDIETDEAQGVKIPPKKDMQK